MKNISIVVPCYNEEKRLKKNIKKFVEFAKKNDSEVIFVNDGSIDSTLNILRHYSKKNKRIKVITYEKNKGKGYAVKKGILNANEKYILMCDVDLSTPLSEIRKLERFKNYDIVIGSREMKNSHLEVKQNIIKRIMGKAGKLAINTLLNLNINDSQCGFKLFNQKIKKIIKQSKINRFGFDFEILYLSRKNGLTIKEVGVLWKNDKESKVKPIDYLKTFIELMKVKFSKYR